MPYNINQIQQLTSPNPFALVSTRKEDGSTNLMALSWWTFASNHPPTVALCISKNSYSGARILATNEFGLNVVDESLTASAYSCGTCSGRMINKPEKFNIELFNASTMETRLVKAHKVALECRLVDTVELADHYLFIAEIKEAHSISKNRHLFALNGYSALGTIIGIPEKIGNARES
jgi:flavin reductase (DIM6/NTAB) family NADH-FMN oxidoreductase RutF